MNSCSPSGRIGFWGAVGGSFRVGGMDPFVGRPGATAALGIWPLREAFRLADARLVDGADLGSHPPLRSS